MFRSTAQKTPLALKVKYVLLIHTPAEGSISCFPTQWCVNVHISILRISYKLGRIMSTRSNGVSLGLSLGLVVSWLGISVNGAVRGRLEEIDYHHHRGGFQQGLSSLLKSRDI